MSYEDFRDDVRQAQARHSDVELHMVWSGPDAPVVLDLIRTLPMRRGQGLAEAALVDVIELADAWQVPLRLTVEPIRGDGTDPARLIAWYARHGFAVVGTLPSDETVVVMQRPPGALAD